MYESEDEDDVSAPQTLGCTARSTQRIQQASLFAMPEEEEKEEEQRGHGILDDDDDDLFNSIDVSNAKEQVIITINMSAH